jgi:hypothetical protein
MPLTRKPTAHLTLRPGTSYKQVYKTFVFGFFCKVPVTVYFNQSIYLSMKRFTNKNEDYFKITAETV